MIWTLLKGVALAGSIGTAEVDLDAVYAPRRVALLIGVDQYQDSSLSPLRYAAKAATDLSAVCSDPNPGDFDRVHTVVGASATSRHGIEKAIALATADLQRDDTFVLYLSGHGTLTLDASAGTSLWFLPSDGDLNDPIGTGIAVEWLEERVGKVEARRRVLIMDTCHNGRSAEGARSSLSNDTSQVLSQLRGEPPAPRELRQVSESEVRLFAAEYFQPAMETPELENGVYTHFLIQAISDAAGAADLDGDGLVDVHEAHDWARDRTMTYTGGMQTPRAEYRIVGREEIYLAGNGATRSAAERALLAATDSLLASASVLVDGQTRGVLPEVVVLEPGVHTIEVQDSSGRSLVKKTVHVRAGETLMVEDLFPDMRPSWEMLGGTSFQSAQSPIAGVTAEVELAWVRPDWGPRWMLVDLHARSSLGQGQTGFQDQITPMSGATLFGPTVAWQAQRIPLSIGPSLEDGFGYRYASGYDGEQRSIQRQSTLLLPAGARAAWRLPLGQRNLVVRADTRFVVTPAVPDLPGYWQHGVAIGYGQR